MRKVQKRSSNLEILRIISMIMIVAHHFAIYGNFPLHNSYMGDLVVYFLSIGGKVGVFCFTFITGYFMITSKNSFKKLFKVIFQVWMYSVILFLVTILLGYEVSIYDSVGSFLPVIFNKYWFVTGYVVVYLLSPFLNEMILKMKQKKLECLLLIVTVVYFVGNTFFLTDIGFNSDKNFLYLIYAYLIGAYIKVYRDNPIKNSKNYLTGFLVWWLLIFIWMSVFGLLGMNNPNYYGMVNIFMRINRLPVLISSIYLFLYFKNKNINNSTIINSIASLTFGVYLFHDNPLVRTWLWSDILNVGKFYYGLGFIVYSIVIIMVVFILGIIIEKFRVLFCKTKLVNNFYLKLENKFTNVMNIDLSIVWNMILKKIF